MPYPLDIAAIRLYCSDTELELSEFDEIELLELLELSLSELTESVELELSLFDDRDTELELELFDVADVELELSELVDTELEDPLTLELESLSLETLTDIELDVLRE